MRILVTGASGYIAGRLLEYLNATTSATLVAASRKPKQTTGAHNTMVDLDYSSLKSLREACQGVEVIIHLAGTDARSSAADPAGAFQVNAVNTGRLIEAAVAEKVSRFLYLSTFHVYGSHQGPIIREGDCLRNSHPYAASHRAGEEILGRYLEEGSIGGCSVRLSNSFGLPANESSSCWTLVANDLARQIALNGKMEIQSDGSPLRDIIPMTEVCRALRFLAFFDGRLSEPALNLGSGKTLMIREIAEMIGARFKNKTELEPIFHYAREGPKSIPKRFIFSLEKLESLGFQPSPDFGTEIDRVLDKFLVDTHE
ncbi:MAG: hypothetical protein CMN76_11695 [Spirochaetaceae bacterium]|nr:hypothetical protein [Spirochaetaceae bacterium]